RSKNMEISASIVKDLRDRTGAGMMEAKNALVEAGGDVEKAVEVLKLRGAAIAEKKSDRAALNGTVGVYDHDGNKIAVSVEVMVETDFVARNPEFIAFANKIAAHIAGMSPKYVTVDQISEADKAEHGEGAVSDLVLMNQSFVFDSSRTVEQFV